MNVTVREDPALDGPANMAADLDLLKRAEAGTIGARVYSWSGPWVTLGRFQLPERDMIAPDGTNWIIRPTGGKAVLHGHDVTIGMAVPLRLIDSGGSNSRSVKRAYRWVVAPIVQALRDCGLPAVLAENSRFVNSGPRTADCFAHVSPNDVVDERTGIKVCGCALRLTDRAVLVQASIPVGPPLLDPRDLIVNASQVCGCSWDASGFGAAMGEALENHLKLEQVAAKK